MMSINKEPFSTKKTRKVGFNLQEINIDLATQMVGKSFHENNLIKLSDLRVLSVVHWNFANQLQSGELIVHKVIAFEVIDIFRELFENHFHIDKIKLMDAYGGNDSLSMKDNNTSAFNYRTVAGETRLSLHSYGLAIDINPIQNPYIKGDLIVPFQGKKYMDRTLEERGMIKPLNTCHRAFISQGWVWGGDFEGRKDYHHFEKRIEGSITI